MLTPDANPSFPAVEPISRVTAIPLTGHPCLFQLAAADFKTGKHRCELAGKAGSPWGGEPCPENHREWPLASHHRCESPMKTTPKQPFTCL